MGSLRRVGIVRTFTVWDPVPQTDTGPAVDAGPDHLREQPGRGRPDRPLTRSPVATRRPTEPGCWPPPRTRPSATRSIRRCWSAGRRRPRPPATATASTGQAVTADPSTSSPSPLRARRPRGPHRRAPRPAAGVAPGSRPRSDRRGPAPGRRPGRPDRRPPRRPASILQVAADAAAWTTRLVAARTGRDVLTLPYGDPDAAALAAGGYGDLLDLADRAAASVTAATFGSPLPDGLVWPVTGHVPTPPRPGWPRAPPAGPWCCPPRGCRSPHPAVRPRPTSGCRCRAGDADAILTDDAVSSRARPPPGASESTLATQRLLAETAAITATHVRPRAGTVLATVPRTWNPDPASVAAALTALHLGRLGTARRSGRGA